MITKSLFRIRRIVLCVMLCCAALLVGCSNKSAMERVEYVLQSAEQEPEAALECISSINPNQIRGARDRARYALAYSEAMYYNRINSDCDTLVTPMMHYYLYDDKHHAERARALYQYALVKQHSCASEAVYSLMESEKSLDVTDNYKLRGLVNRTFGDIYGKEYLFKNSYDSHKRAKEFFELAKLERHAMYSLQDMGWAAMQMQDYECADSLLQLVKSYALIADNRSLLINTLDLLINLNIKSYISDYNVVYKDRINTNLELLDSLHTQRVANIDCYKAIYAAFDGDAESAESYLSMADLQLPQDDEYKCYAKYLVHYTLNNDREALYNLNKISTIKDEYIFTALNKSVLSSQVDILAKDVKLERQKYITSRYRYLALILCVIFVFVLLSFAYLYRSAWQQNNINKYLHTITELKTILNNNNTLQSSAIYQLHAERFSELNSICDTYYENSDSPKLHNVVFKRLCETIDAIKNDKLYFESLIGTLNYYHNGIIDDLTKYCTTLTPREKRIVIYSYAGFSLRAISIFIDSKPETVSKAKYKIKVKIRESQAPNSDRMIQLLL